MPALRQVGDRLIVETEQYRLILNANDGTWADLSRDSAPVARLFLPGAVDSVEGPDVTLSVAAPIAKEKPGRVVFIVRSQSSLWGQRVTKLRCRDEMVELDIRVEGDDLVENVHLFGGWTPTGPARSTAHFNRVFDPSPNAQLKQNFAPDARAIISVRDHTDWLNGAWFFTPAPLAFCLRAATANWLAAAVAARPGAHTFEDFSYEGDGGFEFRLNYAAHTATGGEWTSPRIALLGAADEYDALAAASAWRAMYGATPQHATPSALWWRSPIFCGWGEQVALSNRNGKPPSAFATQANYERWLNTLAAHDLHPGIIVIDDKWQGRYGDPRPDPAKWPDMRGFIRRQHEMGRRVILWWKAWDAEGVPVEEQVSHSPWPEGSVDPTSAAYRERLSRAVARLIGDLDADGFKIDFAHRTPYGRAAQVQGRSWGIELLRDLIAQLSDAAKSIKPDALIVSQTPDPYFCNIVDMIRLNNTVRMDMADQFTTADILTNMTHRARVARAASADWLIDTNSWPSLDRAQWLSYVQRQVYLGNPSLYYATAIDRTGEPLRPEDYAVVSQAWKTYLRRRQR